MEKLNIRRTLDDNQERAELLYQIDFMNKSSQN